MTYRRRRTGEKAWQHWQRACELGEAYQHGYERAVADIMSKLKVTT